MLAYDAATGTQLWKRSIADPMLGELVTAAPIAWRGLVLIGTAGGDTKGVKGRMYALDAATGEVRWEFYLVPKGPHDLTRGPEAPATPELKQQMAEELGERGPEFQCPVGALGRAFHWTRRPASSTCPAAIRRPTSCLPCGPVTTSWPIRWWCSMPRPAPTSATCQWRSRIFTIGMCRLPRLCSPAGLARSYWRPPARTAIST